MIEFIDLAKKYPKANDYAVKLVSMKIDSGKIIGFIGHNGAGKSTTLKMMTGILPPSQGDVELNGYSITKDPMNAKRQFGYVPDSSDVFLKLTGLEYLNFIGKVYDVDDTTLKTRIDELSKEYLMDDKLNDLIDSYSYGMRQKIIVMGALLHDPSIFLLDEPLRGLDPVASKILKDSMVDHAKKGNTVLFSTHVLEVAEKLCDEIIVINKGEFIYHGTLDDLKAKYPESASLEDIFFKITDYHD